MYVTLGRGAALTATAAAAAAAAALVLYARRRDRRRKSSFLPLTLPDRRGKRITIRFATPADKASVETDIADTTGTGSGVGNDNYLLQEFNRCISDPDFSVLYAEDAETGKGLAMVIVVWASSDETYVQMLRVGAAARGSGVANLLFRVGAKLTVQRQGRDAIGRWGVVSTNEIMTSWSTRLGLHGPQAFRRYSVLASAGPPPPGYELPAGWSLREATVADEAAIWAALQGFPVMTSEFGSQNFVLAGWGVFKREHLTRLLVGGMSRGIPTPKPRVIIDESGGIAAFVSLAKLFFGDTPILFYRYMDGSPEAVRLMLHALPAVAAELDCERCGGYGPTLPWFLAHLDESPVFERATTTEQHEFHWKPADYDTL